MIDKTEYINITTGLGEVFQSDQDAMSSLVIARDNLSSTDWPTDSEDILSFKITSSLDYLQNSTTLLNLLCEVVYPLQSLVSLQSGSVDEYLDSVSGLVTASFAELSNLCSFPIDSDYVEVVVPSDSIKNTLILYATPSDSLSIFSFRQTSTSLILSEGIIKK